MLNPQVDFNDDNKKSHFGGLILVDNFQIERTSFLKFMHTFPHNSEIGGRGAPSTAIDKPYSVIQS